MTASPAPDYALLEQRLSADRLTKYRAATSTDPAAFALYRWNSDASLAMWHTLAHLEVVMRNAMHHQLAAESLATFGEARWYNDPGRRLTSKSIDAITRARQRIRKDETPGRVVAALSLDVWFYLLGSSYDRSLWPILTNAFPHGPRFRRHAHDVIERLYRLRNRIAHHEPILRENLRARRNDAITVANWICPITAQWIDDQCTVTATIAARP